MQEINYKFIETLSKKIGIKNKKILEVGSFQVNGQEYLDLRPLFKESNYIGCDMRNGKGVDVVTNSHNFLFNDNTFDIIICLDTLEHDSNPFKSLSEMKRILKNRGVIILSSVMYCPIHDYPSDYFRYTPEGFKELTKDFAIQFTGYLGTKEFPQNIYAVCTKRKNTKLVKNIESALKQFCNMPKNSKEPITNDLITKLKTNLKKSFSEEKIEFKLAKHS